VCAHTAHRRLARAYSTTQSKYIRTTRGVVELGQYPHPLVQGQVCICATTTIGCRGTLELRIVHHTRPSIV
jgi:hypothetical protein